MMASFAHQDMDTAAFIGDSVLETEKAGATTWTRPNLGVPRNSSGIWCLGLAGPGLGSQ